MKKHLRTILMAIILCTSALAFAGDRGGNGGDGITIDGKLYVLDLVEAGLEQNPVIDHSVEVPADISNTLSTIFKDSSYPVSIIGKKLAEINRIDPVSAKVILKAMDLYTWRLVNSGLVNIQDENSLLDYEGLSQLAIRRNNIILISKTLWLQLDEANKAALVFHEIMYAMNIPVMKNDKLEQDSVKTRELIGYLFSEELKLENKNELRVLFYHNLGQSISESFQGYHQMLEGPTSIRISPRIKVSRIAGKDPDEVHYSKVKDVGYSHEGRSLREMCTKKLGLFGYPNPAFSIDQIYFGINLSLETEDNTTYVKVSRDFTEGGGIMVSANQPGITCEANLEKNLNEQLHLLRSAYEKTN